MKSLVVLIISFLLISNSYAQKESYIPLNIKKAFDKGTRSHDGNPGPNYWQNRAKYDIKVSLDPRVKLLVGSQKVTYYNNSPDSLNQIVIRLHHNITKPNARRDLYLSDKALTDGVKLNRISVQDSDVALDNNSKIRVVGTNLLVTLKDKLPPKSNINLAIEWETVIPAIPPIRYGSYDSTSMFVAYWYPQISVYDDVDGWDLMDYTGTLEMYNDFNDYNVEFTVPVGFQIWATGVWQNPEEILNKKYLDRYYKAWQSDEVINIVTKSDFEANDIYKSDSDNHTIKFSATNTPDFAFGISDHYLWDATSFIPDKNSDKRIFVATAYRESSTDFVENANYAKETLKFFSSEIPGVPYPYPSATVFNGGGGMEFPMIVNNGREDSKAGTVGLTSHELAHQYMPFYMGTNERKYPFMDEGWAVMLPYDFQERMVEGNTPRIRTVKGYEAFAGNEYELPLMIPSPAGNWRAYRMSAYNKPAIAYDILRKTLGDTLFLKALKTYIARWNGKHPIPTDFFFTFNEVIGKDLDWFWKPWFYNFGYPDLSIHSVKQKGNTLTIEIKNHGKLPLPVKLQVMNDGEVVKEFYKTAELWMKGEEIIKVKVPGIKKFEAVILGSELIPDVNSVNNVYIK